MKVIKWISFEEASKLPECPLSRLGGWFQDGMRWEDYYKELGEEARPYAEALRAEVLAKRIRHGGDWHQYSEEGIPVFEDGTIASFSFRAWGDFMAAVWSSADNRDYNYMDFYMDCLVHDDENPGITDID